MSYLHSNFFPCRWAMVQVLREMLPLSAQSCCGVGRGGYLSACIIQSDFEFTFTTHISQLVCRSHSNYLMLRCLLISEIFECKTQKTPVCYLQYSQCSGAFLLRSQFLYIFLYRCIYRGIFSRIDFCCQSYGNMRSPWSSYTNLHGGCGRIPIGKNRFHSLYSLPCPHQTRPNQTTPIQRSGFPILQCCGKHNGQLRKNEGLVRFPKPKKWQMGNSRFPKQSNEYNFWPWSCRSRCW